MYLPRYQSGSIRTKYRSVMMYGYFRLHGHQTPNAATTNAPHQAPEIRPAVS